MATTFRTDLRAAHVLILDEQKVATPALLAKVYDARPGSFPQTPAAFVGPMSESIIHDAGTRTRLFDGHSVFLVDSYTDNSQTADRLDQLVDALVDRYDEPANIQRVPKTLIELTDVSDVPDFEARGADGQTVTFYRAVELTFGRSQIKEGRQ